MMDGSMTDAMGVADMGSADSSDGGRDATTDASDAAAEAMAVGDGGSDAPAALKGAVQKGPFILGSTVSLSTVDSSGTPTGQVFTTQTTSDLGDFDVTFAYRGNVDMQAQGFYYDEVTGSLSTAPIVLRALYSVTTGGPQNAYINIITHLAHDRAVSLMADGGMSLQAAEAQAESELVLALGIGGTGLQPGDAGINLNELGANDAANAYLFAVSAILVQAAREQAADGGGAVDAQLQELLDTIAADLANNGQLPPALTSQIQTAQQDLDVDLTTDFFAYRLQAIGSAATAADLNLAVDSDGDGYRNSIDTCPLVANPNQAQIPQGVICKITRHTTFLPTGSIGPGSGTQLILGDFINNGFLGVFGLGLDGSQAGLLGGSVLGRFTAPQPVQLMGLSTQFPPVTAFDVNADGNLDVVSEESWAAGDGAGHFATAVAFSPPVDAGTDDAGYPLSIVYQGLALADFNGDGLADLVRFKTQFDQYGGVPTGLGMAVSLGTAKGAFANETLYPIPGPIASPDNAFLAVKDVNHDQKLDIVALDWGCSPIACNAPGATNPYGALFSLLGDGAGKFQLGGTPLQFPTGVDPYTTVLTDFDGDGNVDVSVWLNEAPIGVIDITYGDGQGGFGSITQAVTTFSNASYGYVAADVNADGKSDLFAYVADPANSNAADFVLLLSQGRTFWPPQTLRTTQPFYQWALVASGDVNGDGIPDVVLGNQDGQSTSTVEALLMGVLQ